jgi:2-amino-4-hydroxy-6-hydroxymethyldihydropteridine diphosphokinase
VFICGYTSVVRPPKLIYLSLGSNVGDRAAHLARAVEALAAAGVRVRRQSSLYATEPVGNEAQGWFLNCVLEAETHLMPRQLLRALQGVERQLGRRRPAAHGPRTVDIDLLFYGSRVLRMRDLEVPHPRMAERRFVLVPLRELAAGLRHPTLKKTVAELLMETRDRSNVRRWRPAGVTR